MAHRGMTLLAQQRRPQFQQRRIRRAVGVVTVVAVLRDRRVLPQERTAVLPMARITGLVDRRLGKQRGEQRVVRLVARCAGHFRVTDRMPGELVEGGADVPVALIANPRLFGTIPDRIVLGVDRMAADQARSRRSWMLPCQPTRLLVEWQDRHASFCCVTVPGEFFPNRADRFARLLGVPAARPVAALALQLRKRRIRITLHSMLGLEQHLHLRIFFVVATATGVGTLFRVRSCRNGCWVCCRGGGFGRRCGRFRVRSRRFRLRGGRFRFCGRRRFHRICRPCRSDGAHRQARRQQPGGTRHPSLRAAHERSPTAARYERRRYRPPYPARGRPSTIPSCRCSYRSGPG